jgi:hypothetical protein
VLINSSNNSDGNDGNNTRVHVFFEGRNSVIRIASGYGLDDTGSNPSRSEIFRTRPDLLWGPPSLVYNEYRGFSRGKAAGAWQ